MTYFSIWKATPLPRVKVAVAGSSHESTSGVHRRYSARQVSNQRTDQPTSATTSTNVGITTSTNANANANTNTNTNQNQNPRGRSER